MMTRRTKDSSWKDAYLETLKELKQFHGYGWVRLFKDGIGECIGIMKRNMPKQTKRYYLPPKAWGLKQKAKR